MNKMNNYYFTFGMNHLDKDGNSLGMCYVAIAAKTEYEALHLLCQNRGDKWAFSYEEDEKPWAIDRHHLTEKTLDEVKLSPSQIGNY